MFACQAFSETLSHLVCLSWRYSHVYRCSDWDAERFNQWGPELEFRRTVFWLGSSFPAKRINRLPRFVTVGSAHLECFCLFDVLRPQPRTSVCSLHRRGLLGGQDRRELGRIFPNMVPLWGCWSYIHARWHPAWWHPATETHQESRGPGAALAGEDASTEERWSKIKQKRFFISMDSVIRAKEASFSCRVYLGYLTGKQFSHLSSSHTWHRVSWWRAWAWVSESEQDSSVVPLPRSVSPGRFPSLTSFSFPICKVRMGYNPYV